MKLLFDQNLSNLLPRYLSDCYQGALHVRDLGLTEAADADLWAYAAKHGLAIVTKDGDFRQFSFLFGPPPKVIWLRLGNCSTRMIELALREYATEIGAFLSDPDSAILPVP